MGRTDGTLYSSKEQYIWVTICESGQPLEVLNRKVAPNLGTYIIVGYDPSNLPKTRQVLGLADAYASHSWLGPDIPIHFADTHGFGKSDCAWILREQLVRYTTVTGENKIKFYPDARVMADGSWWWTVASTEIDYSAVIPTSGHIICVIVVDGSANIALRVGSAGTTRASLTAANWPTLVAGDSALVAMVLYAGMVEAHHDYGNDDFIDLSTSGAYSGTTSGITNLVSDVVADGPGIATATIQPEAVTNAKRAKMAAHTVSGNKTGSDAVPQDLTMDDLLTMGAGAFGGAQEVVNETPDGLITHFTFTNSAASIFVMVDGVMQKSADVTFTAYTSAFDLAFAPQTGADVRVIRLVPVVVPAHDVLLYDSGWFAINTSQKITKTHNLGTQRLNITVYLDNHSDGSSGQVSPPYTEPGTFYGASVQINNDDNSFDVVMGANGYVKRNNSGTYSGVITSGIYCRVVAVGFTS